MCSRPIASILLFTVLACNGDDGETGEEGIPECVEFELDGCTALYPPTYDQVWTQTVQNNCSSTGSSCHAQMGSGDVGLTFLDPQASWEYMTSHELVVPGDPLCSPLFVRVAIDDPEIRMPPGTSGLSPTALCSIGTWIANGAEYVAP